MGQYDSAKVAFEKSIAIKGRVCQKFINLGNALFGLGDMEGAAATFKKAVDSDRNSARRRTISGSRSTGRATARARRKATVKR